MSHANNGTTDLNAWVGIFKEFCDLMGIKADMGELYGKLYRHSLTGDKDCGGLLAYGFYSGENVIQINEGRPLYARTPESHFTLANLMRSNLYTSLGAVKLGMDILTKEEHVRIDRITGHGGLFKTEGVAQNYLAAAIHAPVTVMKTASEGGPWGMAVLAAYLIDGGSYKSLGAYLDEKIFAGQEGITVQPDPEDEKGFETFTDHYKAGIEVEKSAIEHLNW
jgi:sugar (pentulose or hexulose) kinase